MDDLILFSRQNAISASLLGILLALFVKWKSRSHVVSDIAKLRKPGGAHWLWGHELAAWGTPDAQWYRRNSRDKEYGLVYAMKGALFHPDIIVMADPAGLNYMYTKRAYKYVRTPVLQSIIERLVGKGLLWATGDAHKRQRAMVGPFFTHQRIRQSEAMIRDLVTRDIVKFLPDDYAEGWVKLDILPWCFNATMDIIGMFCFGYDFGCGETPESKVVRSTFEQQARMGMTTAGFATPLVLRAFPSAVFEGLFRFAKVQSAVRDTIKEAVGKEILARRKRQESEAVDLLDELMKSVDFENELEVDELLDQMVTMMVTGHETSSKIIALTLLELARNSTIQAKLRHEVTTFVGSGPNGSPTYDQYLDSKALPLLNAVVNESIRLYPIGSHTELLAEEDDVVPLRFPIKSCNGDLISSIKVEKGQIFYMPSMAINTSHQVWGPTADTFDPYRWIKEGGMPPPTELTSGVNGHFSFGEGPRLCVGYRLAQFETKVIVSELIKLFEFSIVGGENIQTIWSSSLMPFVEGRREDGVQVPLLVRSLI